MRTTILTRSRARAAERRARRREQRQWEAAMTRSITTSAQAELRLLRDLGPRDLPDPLRIR